MDENVGSYIPDLPDDVQLTEPFKSLPRVGAGSQSSIVIACNLADGVQLMINEAPPLAIHGGGDTTAAVVANNQYVFHLEHLDRELQH